jgi:hypothetical protein
VLASLFLCCGSVAAAWIRMRKLEQDAERLDQDFIQKTKDHDDAYLRLESRVEDLAGRLARTAAERRELSGTNQRFSADNQALAAACGT